MSNTLPCLTFRYFAKNHAILLLALTLFMSCTNEYIDNNVASDTRNDFISAAKQLYLDALSLSTKALADEDIFLFNQDIVDIDWNSSSFYENSAVHLAGIESQFSSSSELTATLPSGESIEVDQELLYVQDQVTGDDDLFYVYYFPDSSYIANHNENLALVLDNDGDGKDFSGVIVYTTLDGCPIRFNQYDGGELVQGLYLPSLDTEEKSFDGFITLSEMLAGVTIQNTEEGTTFEGGVLEESICVAQNMTQLSWQMQLEIYSWLNWVSIRTFGGGGSVDPSGTNGNSSSSPSAQQQTDSESSQEKDEKESLESVRNRICNTIVDSTWSAGSGRNVEILTNVLDSIMTIAQDNDVLANILKNTKNLQTIEILNTLNPPQTVRDKYTKIAFKIKIPEDQLTTDNIIYKMVEELFHTSQQAAPNDGWGNGDYEFEAKIYECMLWRELGKDTEHYPFDNDAVKVLLKYYDNPSESNYNNAIHALRSLGYPASAFPINITNINDKLKHIKSNASNINRIK